MHQFHGKSWSERYKKNAIVLGEDEEKVEIKCKSLTEVVSLTVLPLYPLRQGEDPNCYIYGQISVKVGQSHAPVKIFHRRREDPALVVLQDRSRNFLSLPDGVGSPPPLAGVSKDKSIQLLLTMELYELKTSGESELIAEVTDFEYVSSLVEGRCSNFVYMSDLEPRKLCFRVHYAVMWGARAEIEVKIKPTTMKDKDQVSISAKIAVVQNLLKCHTGCGQAIRTLYDGSEQVHVGDKLHLQRSSVFGLPLAKNQYLTIVVTVKEQSATVKEEPVLVDFPIKLVTKDSFMTNTDLTHTKDVPGTPFSVSIRILPLPGTNQAYAPTSD